jgi:hypothetical protein
LRLSCSVRKFGLRLRDQNGITNFVLSVIIAGMAFTLPFGAATRADDRVQGQGHIDRDHDRMKTARGIEEKLEHALKTGEPKDFYRPAIENMGKSLL